MTIFQSIVLGAVQGITEFLPVSSSGHLVLLQKILNIDEPPLFFDTMVHVGTLGAVVIVLRREVWGLLKKPFQKCTLLLVVATLPVVAVALLFKDLIENAFHGGALLGPAFLFTACVLTVSEWVSARALRTAGKRLDEITLSDALVIGVCQSIAILPAVSRSGLTLSGSLLRNIDRGDAARFSFLLSIPAILGALVLQVASLGESGPATGPIPLATGMLTAFVTGLLSVKLMLKIVREKRLFGFAVYTAVLGILCVVFRQA
ncbi:MAG: undecaprenyl-diphosphate phosphatase [Spirochaetaceae bacterium]|nr:undecaprenyl-diphosphate phosphatase [Spirochaetaceae bacterium]